jgi:hypothetical protein
MKRLTSENSLKVESVESAEPVPFSMAPKPRVDSLELPKSVLDYDLKKMPSFKQKRRKYKFASQGKLFVQELSVVLDQYEPEEHQFDLELLLTVLNIAESFFIHGSKDERNAQKKQAVEDLMLVYFRDDAMLLELMRKNLWRKVKKSGFIRRQFRKIKSFFF